MSSLGSEGSWGGTEVVFENTNFWFTIGITSFSPPAKETLGLCHQRYWVRGSVLAFRDPLTPKWSASLNCPMSMQWASSKRHPRPATLEGCQQRLFPPGMWHQSPSLTAPTPSPPDETLDPQAFCCFENCCLNSQVRDCFSLSLLLLYCARRVCFTPGPVFIANTLFWPLSELLRVDYIISKQWLRDVPKASSDWYVVESTGDSSMK